MKSSSSTSQTVTVTIAGQEVTLEVDNGRSRLIITVNGVSTTVPLTAPSGARSASAAAGASASSSASGWEVIPQQPAQKATATRVRTSLARCERARVQGEAAKLRIEDPDLARTPLPPAPDVPEGPLPADKYWVIISTGLSPAQSGLVSSLRRLKQLVGEPPRAGSIYQGFASKEECENFWWAAGKALPLPSLD